MQKKTVTIEYPFINLVRPKVVEFVQAEGRAGLPAKALVVDGVLLEGCYVETINTCREGDALYGRTINVVKVAFNGQDGLQRLTLYPETLISI